MLSPMAALVRRHDRDRFLTAIFAPAARREALFTLYAFNHELARAREVASEPRLALIRLHWWREVVAGAPRRHEVATPLRAAIAAGLFEATALADLIAAREIEAEPAIPTRAAWWDYVRASAGGLAVVAGKLLGAPAAAEEPLCALGAAYGVAGVLRSLAVHARAGRVLIPVDLLAEHGLTPEHVIAKPDAAALRDVRAALAVEGRALLAAAKGVDLPPAAIAAALPAVLARRDLAYPQRPPRPRGFGDRLAVTWAGLAGRL